MNLKINGNGNGNGHRNGNGNGHTNRNGRLVKWALLVLAIVVVSVLLFRQATRLAGPKATVWVASTNLQAGTILGESELKAKKIRQKKLPAGAVASATPLQGARLARAKEEGDPITAEDVSRPRQQQAPQGLATLVPEGRVLIALRFEPMSAPYTQYRRGDRLEVVAVDKAGSRAVASDAYLIGWLSPASGGNGNGKKESLFGIDLSPPKLVSKSGGGSSLLLALHPEHVFPVAEAEATGAKMSFVLHGDTELQAGRLLALPGREPTAAVEVIAGARRQQVVVN